MKLERIFLTGEGKEAYLDAYLADKTANFTRKALLVIPGGGYSCVCADREGEPIAQAFLPYGYQAFVLHYHTAKEKPFPVQLIQTAKAIRHIRDHAEEYGIHPEQLFVVGFSAGGHLAASAGVLWKHPAVLEQVEMPYGYNKPNGVMLIYPVISWEYHKFSFQNLWCRGELTEEQKEQCSIEKHVDKDSAPAFILHTSNDQVVDVRNSLVLAEAYTKAGLEYEMHIYPDAPHGAALSNAITAGTNPKWNNASIAEWVRQAAAWGETQVSR